MFHIYCLDVQEFVASERGILSHDAEVGAGLSVLWHHLVCGVHIEQGYRLFLTFFLCRKFLKHAHLECAENLTSSTTQSNKDVVTVAKACLCHRLFNICVNIFSMINDGASSCLTPFFCVIPLVGASCRRPKAGCCRYGCATVGLRG